VIVVVVDQVAIVFDSEVVITNQLMPDVDLCILRESLLVLSRQGELEIDYWGRREPSLTKGQNSLHRNEFIFFVRAPNNTSIYIRLPSHIPQ
jgi:hypothetical protein